MIGADETGRLAMLELTYRRGTMPAAVEHDMHHTLAITRHYDRVRPDECRDEVTGCRQITAMRNPDPVVHEDAIHLHVIQIRIAVDRAIGTVVVQKALGIGQALHVQYFPCYSLQ